MSPTEDPNRVAVLGVTDLALGINDDKVAHVEGSLQMISDL